MTSGQKDRLFELLEEHCTNEALKRVLDRHRKEDKDIRVSGAGPDLLSHLRQANGRGTVADDELVELLAEAEENGHQHVLFYRPRNAQIRASSNDIATVEKGLLNGKTRDEAKLPKFFIDLDGTEIADFRTGALPDTEYTTWIFKLYAGLERVKYLGQKDLGNNRFMREYERYRSREVLLVKWHSFGLLELRIAAYQSMSRKSFIADLAQLWNVLAPTINEKDFEPLDIPAAAAKLVADAQKRSAEYVCGKACFRDDNDGEVSFSPADPDEALHESKVRCQASRGLKDCTQLIVTWLNHKKDARLPEKLRTELGCYFPHEVRIGAQTTSEAVNNVAYRLHELSK